MGMPTRPHARTPWPQPRVEHARLSGRTRRSTPWCVDRYRTSRPRTPLLIRFRFLTPDDSHVACTPLRLQRVPGHGPQAPAHDQCQSRTRAHVHARVPAVQGREGQQTSACVFLMAPAAYELLMRRTARSRCVCPRRLGSLRIVCWLAADKSPRHGYDGTSSLSSPSPPTNSLRVTHHSRLPPLGGTIFPADRCAPHGLRTLCL